MGISNITAFAIHVDEGIGDGDGGRSVAELEDVGMNLSAEAEVAEGSGGLENGGEGKVVRWDCHCQGGVRGNGVAEEVVADLGTKGFDP